MRVPSQLEHLTDPRPSPDARAGAPSAPPAVPAADAGDGAAASSAPTSTPPLPASSSVSALHRSESVNYLEYRVLPWVNAVHTREYLEKLRSTCEQLTSARRQRVRRPSPLLRNLSGVSGDTFASSSSLSAALCGVLATCRAIDAVAAGRSPDATRPRVVVMLCRPRGQSVPCSLLQATIALHSVRYDPLATTPAPMAPPHAATRAARLLMTAAAKGFACSTMRLSELSTLYMSTRT